MGVGGMSFGGGFAGGLAQVLAQKRQEENLKKEREINNNFKMLGLILDSGQVSDIADLQPYLDTMDLGLPKSKGKQGGPTQHIGNMLGHIMRNSQGQPTGRGESQGPMLGAVSPSPQAAPEPTDTGAEPPLPSKPLALPQTVQAPPERRTLMGIPLLSHEEATQRALQEKSSALNTELEGQIALARRMLPALQAVDPGITMRDALAYAANRQFPSKAGVAAAERPMAVSPGSTVINPTTGEVMFQAPEKAPAQTPDRTVTVSPGSRVVNPKTGEVIYEAPDRPAAAGKASEDDTALAEMAANNPAVLQGLTPTVAGSVMRGIAANPQLKARFEEVRMQPIREQATAVLSTLDQLLDVDAKGNVKGLKPGAAGLYGVGLGRLTKHIPGTETATAAAALDQITGQLTLDTIRSMKEQSRTGATGFGALSARELDVLQRSATMLKGEISEAEALKQLKSLRERFAKVLEPSATTAAAGAAKPNAAPAAKKDANGNWVLTVP